MLKIITSLLFIATLGIVEAKASLSDGSPENQLGIAKTLSNVDSSLYLLENLYRKESFKNNPALQIDLLNQLGLTLLHQNKNTEALSYLRQAEDLCRAHDLLSSTNAFENRRAVIKGLFLTEGEKVASQKIEQNIQLYNVMGIPSTDMNRLFNIAENFYHIKKPEKSILHYFKIAASNLSEHQKFIEQANLQIAKLYFTNDQFERAVEHLNIEKKGSKNHLIEKVILALRAKLQVDHSNVKFFEEYFIEKSNSSNSHEQILSEIGLAEIYLHRNELDKSASLINSSNLKLEQYKSHKTYQELKAYHLLISAHLFYKNKDYLKSLNQFKLLEDEYSATDWYQINLRSTLLKKSLALKSLGKYQLVFDQLSLYDSLTEAQSLLIRQAMHENENEFQNSQLEQQRLENIALLDLEKKENTFQKWVLLFSILGVIGLGSYLYFLYKNSKTKHIVKVQQDNIEEINQTIILEEKAKLKKDLESKKRRLTAYTLEMVRKNEYLESLKEEIDSLEHKKIADQKTGIHKLRRRLEYQESFEKDWEVFRSRFEAMHPQFFTTLLEKYPSLSNSELRLCAFLLLDYSSSEIANLLHLSKGSINTFRYRIRKKLVLTETEDLKAFLQKLNKSKS